MTVGNGVSVVVGKAWWKSAIVYQIYPASFKDSNGDGVGDIPGIISKLDYIASLGVNVIWVCPTYASPQIDMGYDISDYEDVYPPYGTLADMEKLIIECHARGIRLMLDLVINHTSDQHAWFQESRKSLTSAKRDWYIWRPATYTYSTGPDGTQIATRKPPNNWRSNFGGGSAWEWDPDTEEYYLHLFAKEQPDLNWENPEVRAAVYNSAMRFWLDRGVDGFRIDTVNMYSKPDGLPDAPVVDPTTPYQPAGHLYCNGPRMHEFLSEMNALLHEYGAITVGELPHTPDPARVRRYVSARERQLDMVFQFDVVDTGMGVTHKFDTRPRNWTLPDLKDAVARCQVLVSRHDDTWSTVFMENHDQARSVSRFASDLPQYRVAGAKLLALLQATLSGTLFIYQGQEIGTVNASLDSYPLSEYRDLDSLLYAQMVAERSASKQSNGANGDSDSTADMSAALAAMQHLARDHARIPMAWDASAPNAGFGEGKPWMKPHPLASEINVASQIDDNGSVLAFWRRALRFRLEHEDFFVYGDFRLLRRTDDKVFSYVKEHPLHADHGMAVVALNFTKSPVDWEPPTREELAASCHMSPAKDDKPVELTCVFSTLGERVEGNLERLAPFEGRVYFLSV